MPIRGYSVQIMYRMYTFELSGPSMLRQGFYGERWMLERVRIRLIVEEMEYTFHIHALCSLHGQ